MVFTHSSAPSVFTLELLVPLNCPFFSHTNAKTNQQYKCLFNSHLIAIKDTTSNENGIEAGSSLITSGTKSTIQSSWLHWAWRPNKWKIKMLAKWPTMWLFVWWRVSETLSKTTTMYSLWNRKLGPTRFFKGQFKLDLSLQTQLYLNMSSTFYYMDALSVYVLDV